MSFEDRMADDLFAMKYLLDAADLAAENHVEIAIVDRRAHGCVGPIIVWNKGEVKALGSAGVEIIRALFGYLDCIMQTFYLEIVFRQLMLGNAESYIELSDLRA